MEMDDEREAMTERFEFEVEDCKRYFGQWDEYDPIAWAILRVVAAQNELANAIHMTISYDGKERVFEEAISERREAVTALQKTLDQEPCDFNECRFERRR